RGACAGRVLPDRQQQSEDRGHGRGGAVVRAASLSDRGVTLGPARYWARNFSISGKTTSGRSAYGKCAAFDTFTSRALGRADAHSATIAMGIASSSPWMISAGALTFFRSAVQSQSPSDPNVVGLVLAVP